jgi:two-component system chemotaxis response regulator CheY
MAFNVLIVDDSSSMRAVIKKTIKMSGFAVGQYLEAGDGIDALEVLNDAWVDLILADINMPRMNGLELMQRLKKHELHRTVPVIMVTTEGSQKKIDEAQSLGAAGYIKKPFTPQDIKETLNRIMGEPENDSVADFDDDEGYDF